MKHTETREYFEVGLCRTPTQCEGVAEAAKKAKAIFKAIGEALPEAKIRGYTLGEDYTLSIEIYLDPEKSYEYAE